MSEKPKYKRAYRNKHEKIFKIRGRKKLAVCTVTAICAVMLIFTAVTLSNPSIAKIKNLKADKISSESIVLKWDRSARADGYFVYKRDEKENGFSKIGTLRGNGKNSFTVKELTQKHKYDFYVTAFRGAPDTVESSDYEVVKVCTRPKKITVTEAKSDSEGSLIVKWKKVSGALGYQIQYTNKKNFSNAQSVKVTASENSVEFQGLESKSTYRVRVRSYITFNKKELMGEWSDESSVNIAEKFIIPNRVDPAKPMVALTFDDGPVNNDTSDRILDTLEKYGAKATFFMLGKNASEHPDNLRRKYKLGMELGNHTWDHTGYGKEITTKDISKTSETIFKICGEYPTAFRSPGGIMTDTILNECNAEGMAAYYWSIDTEDWRIKDVKTIWKSVVDKAQDGDIILMHELYGSTADAVRKIVPKLIKKGFQLVTCRELISAKTGSYPEVGKLYYKAP